MDTVGIIGAMDEEIEFLVSTYGVKETYERGGCVFHLGEHDRFRIVLLKSGIGKVNAAIGTTLLISLYDPMCVINTGSAGAVDRDLDVGDVVVSSETGHHDVDATSFGYALGQVPRMPDAFLPHSVLVDMARETAGELEHLRVRTGGIITGDSFINDRAKIDSLRENFPAALATEMEAAAIAQTCHQFRKPFVIIRSISDRADGGAHVSFEEFLEKAAVNSARIVQGIVSRLESYVPEKERCRLEGLF